jgi:uncharacterized protein YcbK (DUF882 family)
MRVSSHFTFEELSTTSHTALLKENRNEALQELTLIEDLAFFAEQVRAFINVPMIITSGFRCEKLNRAVGGAANSQHIFFRAIDFIPKGMSIDECFSRLKMSNLVYGQLIKESGGVKEWVHVSMGYKKENLIYKEGKCIKI